MDPRAPVIAELTAPGGPWEVTIDDVLGEPMPVFARRAGSLREVFAAAAAGHAGCDYLVTPEWRVAYDDLAALTGALSHALGERYDVGPGDRVVLWGANAIEWALAFWAVVTRGAIVAAFNDRWTPAEAQHALEQCEPRLLIADGRARQCLAAIAGGATDRWPVLDFETARDLANGGAVALPDTPIAEDEPALILYTSGTTGRAKGALISHRGLVGFVQVQAANVAIGMELARRFGVEMPAAEPVRVLMTAPMFHVSGLLAGILLSAANGETLILQPGRFDPEEVLRTIASERVTNWAPLGAMGPRVLDVLAAQPGKHDVSSIRQLGFGGAPLSPTLRQRLLAAFPNAQRAGMGYGSSETVAVVTGIGGPEFDRFPTSAGRLMPTMALEIRDAGGNPVPDGTEGEIHVRSAYSMLRYWRNEAATAAAVKPGRWLATGDIGTWRDAMLWINSRARDMILRSGENISPTEIEHRLLEHPAVAEVAVLGVDHEVLGQEVKAVVVPVAGATADRDELAQFAAETLARYKVPTQWEFRSEPLPRNAAGKVVKDALRSPS